MSRFQPVRRRVITASQSGFTLLELLLAIAVFALVGLAASTTLSAILDGRDSYQAKARKLDRIELIFTLLEKDFAQIANSRLRDQVGGLLDGPWQYSEFDQRMEWLTHNAWAREIQPDATSVSRVTWSWNDETLTRSAVALRNPLKALEESEPLLTIESLEWGFFHRDDWLAYPPVDGSLPAAVSVTLQAQGLGKMTRSFLMPERSPDQAAGDSS